MLTNPTEYQRVYAYTQWENEKPTDKYRLIVGLLVSVESLSSTNFSKEIVKYRRFSIVWGHSLKLMRYNEHTEYLFDSKAEAQEYIKNKLKGREKELWGQIHKLKEEIALKEKQIIEIVNDVS